jgi:hypothetical protein
MRFHFSVLRNAVAAVMAAAVLLAGVPTAASAGGRAATGAASSAPAELTALAAAATDVPGSSDASVLIAPDSYPCGSACDDKNPYYIWKPPGGPSNYFSCAEDAQVKAIIAVGRFNLQLMYSKRCRSVWARGPHLFNFVLQSFNGSKLRTQRYTESISSIGDTSFVYTVMLNDANLQARVCSGGTGPDVLAHCSAKY